PGGAVEHRRLAQRALRAGRDGGRDLAQARRRAALQLRHLRRDPRGGDVAATRRAHTEPSPRGRVPRRRPRRAAVRRGWADDGLMALLEVTQLRKEFGGLVAVDSVDFRIEQGSISSLIGPNGAGKTTFFNMLTGVYKPTSGMVVFDGQDVTGKPPHAITERGV